MLGVQVCYNMFCFLAFYRTKMKDMPYSQKKKKKFRPVPGNFTLPIPASPAFPLFWAQNPNYAVWCHLVNPQGRSKQYQTDLPVPRELGLHSHSLGDKSLLFWLLRQIPLRAEGKEGKWWRDLLLQQECIGGRSWRQAAIVKATEVIGAALLMFWWIASLDLSK